MAGVEKKSVAYTLANALSKEDLPVLRADGGHEHSDQQHCASDHHRRSEVPGVRRPTRKGSNGIGQPA